MERIYVKLDNPEDGPLLQEYCESLGIKRWKNQAPTIHRHWVIDNELLTSHSNYSNNWITFTEFKEKFSMKSKEDLSCDNFYVKVTPEISEALQKMAHKKEYVWDGSTKLINSPHNYLRFDERGASKHITHAITHYYKEYPVKSVDYAIAFLSKLEPFKIQGYEVIYDGDICKIGCKTLTKDEVGEFVSLIRKFSLTVNGSKTIIKLDSRNKYITVDDNTVSFDEIEKLYEGFSK